MVRIWVIIILILLLIAAIGGGVWYLKRPRSVQTWRLPDGSEVSLAAVTYGQKHRVRYDDRWQDVLSPLLPDKVQSRFGSRVAMHTSSAPNAVVVWIWHKQIPSATLAMGGGTQPDYQLATVDENGLESEMRYGPNCNYYLPKTGNTLSGWELEEYPRRSKQIGIRIYATGSTGSYALAAEFKVRNGSLIDQTNWLAEQLPATRKTNGIEISLVKLETGLTESDVGFGSGGRDAKAFTRGVFTIRDQGKTTEDWRVAQITASADSGEVRPVLGNSGSWRDHKYLFNFTGALWLEEPAWKLKVEVSRNAGFPPSELWTIKGVAVPASKKINEMLVQTNMYGEEIEFLGLSSPLAKLPQDWTETQPEANLHARTAYPLSGERLTLVEVRDDQGRKLETGGFAISNNTGGRGATVRQTDYGFAVKIPEGAKSLDVTFAFSQSRDVEFLVKPVMAERATKQ